MTSVFGTDSSYLTPSNYDKKKCKTNINPNSILGKIIQNPYCKDYLEYIQYTPDIIKKLNDPRTTGTFFIPYEITKRLYDAYEIRQFVKKNCSPIILEPSFFQQKKIIPTIDPSVKMYIENTLLNDTSTILSYQLIGDKRNSSVSAIIYYTDIA